MSGLLPELPERPTPVNQAVFEQTQGGSLICCMVMIFLYGIATLQTYLYYFNYEHDSRWIKLLVFSIWSLATTHTFMIAQTIWRYDILSYSNPGLILDGEWSLYAGTAVGILCCFIVQLFFARTIYYLTVGRVRWAITTFFALVITSEIGFGLFLVVKMFILWNLPSLADVVYDGMVPLLVSRVLADATTSIALCILLRHTRGSFGRSIKLANTLIIYAANRFVLTGVVVVVQTIILVARPASLWAMAIEFVTVGLYINSLLASLNSRSQLRSMDSGTMEYQSRSLKTPNTLQSQSQNNRITVTTTQTRYVDGVSSSRSPVDLNMKFQSSDEGLDSATYYSSEGKVDEQV